MTILFGDDEPEDAWHPDDPVFDLIDNLVRRVELLTRRRQAIVGDDEGRLDQIDELVRRARRKRLYGRDLVRADQLDEDIAHLRTRI